MNTKKRQARKTTEKKTKLCIKNTEWKNTKPSITYSRLKLCAFPETGKKEENKTSRLPLVGQDDVTIYI